VIHGLEGHAPEKQDRLEPTRLRGRKLTPIRMVSPPSMVNASPVT